MANCCFLNIQLRYPQETPKIIQDEGTTKIIVSNGITDVFAIFDAEIFSPKQNVIIILGWVKWFLRQSWFKQIVEEFKPEKAFASFEELSDSIYGAYRFMDDKFEQRFLTEKEIEEINKQFTNGEDDSYSAALKDKLETKPWEITE
ncbi:MAG: hypothetical protein ACP6IQ_01950 [Candidatus Njordarchaeia archaeon]